jgi:hypothetical protein
MLSGRRSSIPGADALVLFSFQGPIIPLTTAIQWRDDDYDVLENSIVVGRIFFLDAIGPQGPPLD